MDFNIIEYVKVFEGKISLFLSEPHYNIEIQNYC